MRELRKNLKAISTLAVALAFVACLSGCNSNNLEESVPTDSDNTSQQIEIPQEETSEATVDVPSEEDKMVAMSVDDAGRANPFVPMSSSSKQVDLSPIPQEKLQYDVLLPADKQTEDLEAKKILTTKVSGIMYDKNNPSAILNIEGSDYLVRSGDVLNGYKVLSIGQSAVTVQYGHNVYRAGVGQLVNSGQGEINYNTVANLSGKFGGAKR